jgi:hypothetical protein
MQTATCARANVVAARRIRFPMVPGVVVSVKDCRGSSGPLDRRAAVALALGGQPVAESVMNYPEQIQNAAQRGWAAFLTKDQLMLLRNPMASKPACTQSATSTTGWHLYCT